MSQTSGYGRKVYQAYLFNRSASGVIAGQIGATGRLYMVVVSAEKCSSTINAMNPYYSADTVDAFELVGRPLIKNG